jgi:hypothetical protein
VRAPTTAELLTAWERGLGQPPARRALALLGTACPEESPQALSLMSVGRRDACLLSLRERVFGSCLVGLVTCPGCTEPLELRLDVADVRMAGDPAEEVTVVSGGYRVRCRLPNSLDLDKPADAPGSLPSWRQLLARCVLEANRGGDVCGPDELPDDVLAAVAAEMALADPQADVRLALDCPACGRRWQAAFDIARLLWAEVEALAHRVLHEVHTLASAYGWREADIIALSPSRRRAYLELADA